MTPANQAIEEIKAILRKHDLAASVFVQAPNESAYLTEIAPTWSCAFYEETPNGLALRIKSKLADYPSKEAQRQQVEATVGMIFAFHNQAERDQDQMARVMRLIAGHFPDISHWERHNPPDQV